MNLQGDFEGLNLSGIFQFLCNDQKTGFLHVTGNDMESRVYFNQGTIVYATSSLKKPRIGFMMVNDGIISSEQLKESLILARDSKQSLGKILVDRGHVSVKTLEKYNSRQVEEIIYNLLFWKKGRFEYKDAALNLKGMIATRLNPMKIILEASRRMDEMSVLKKIIPTDKMVFMLSARKNNKEEFKLNANEWKILSLVDGNRTVRQLIQESGYDEFAVYKILFSVISYGLIEKKEAVQKKEVPSENQNSSSDLTALITVFDDIFQAIYKHLHLEIGEQAASLFKECRQEMDPLSRVVLGAYNFHNPKDSNIQAIMEVMEMEKISRNHPFLIHAFSRYCAMVLKRAGNILGSYPVTKILKEIENVLRYITKYQALSKEKTEIINSMRAVIEEITSL